MTHNKPRRKKYDQTRTPWTRIGPREREILDAGMGHVNSVPYKVSMRWLFYRLLQDGFYKSKDDYKNNCTKLFSRARHTGQGGWQPDTLVDEGRDFILRAGGSIDEADAVESVRQYVMDAADVTFDHFYRQKNYVELWFEAAAMASQFKHYTRDLNLVPMAGAASIPFKWEIAKRLETAARRYGLPIRVLYFGDHDPAGHEILEAIEKDVRRWCEAEFAVTWCGLTAEQAAQYGVPKSVEGKGFQWEALPDAGAREIITAAVDQYINPDLINEAKEDAESFADEWRERLEAVFDSVLAQGQI